MPRHDTTAAALLDTLASLRVRHIFGIVGREADSIGFTENSEITFIPTHHEGNAGFMAIAMARMTGRPQVCFSTIGPGSTNLATPLATAMLDRYPLLAITAQVETHELTPNFAHQCVDGRAICEPVTKFSYELSEGDDIREVVRHAFRVMTEPPNGPALISIPNDILKARAGNTAPNRFEQRLRAAQALDPSSVATLANALNESEQPLIVAGDLAARGGCSDVIAELASSRNIPVVSSYSGKGVLAPDNPRYFGVVTPHMDSMLEYPALAEIFGPVDCLLLVGYDLAEHLLPRVWETGLHKRVLRLSEHPNPNPAQLRPDLDVIVPVLRDSLIELGRSLRPHARMHHVDGMRKRVDKLSENRATRSTGLLPEQVITALNRRFSDYILANDVGFHRHLSALFFRANRPLDFITSAGLSSFGTGLPYGIGAKLAQPDREVVVVAGDVGFHSSSSELETAARLGLKLTVLVLNNGKAGLIERYQQVGLGEINPQILNYGSVDFAALARANGCDGCQVKNLTELEAALARASAARGVYVIDLPIDYPDNYVNRYTRNFHARD